MGVDAAPQIDTGHFRTVLFVLQHPFGRDLAGTQDFLVVVDVVQESVQRHDARAQAGCHRLPFGSWNDVRQHVEKDQPFLAGLFPVYGEGDADPMKQDLRRAAHLLDPLRRGPGNPVC
jgi:hypothetical protein